MKTNSIDKKDIQVSFKTCTGCGFVWNSRNEFILNDNISLVGYQPNFIDIEAGLLLFNHNIKKCGTTFALRVGIFTDLYIGPVFDKAKIGTMECEEKCLDQNNMDQCSAVCKYVYVREIMKFFKKVM
ncbi:MAG: hypothetical protein V3W18_10605 [candidate division Zixibacteria bacterium]